MPQGAASCAGRDAVGQIEVALQLGPGEGPFRGCLSRFAYTEILDDEKKETAAGFWERANQAFNAAGITVKRILTDNGSCYRSHAFKDALGPDIYARPYISKAGRVAAFPGWLHDHSHRRGHTSLKGQPPASRAARKS